MEYVRIAILSAYDKVCAHMDNEAEEALHYYNDELTEYLKGTAATYTFSANAQHPDSQHLVEGNKIAFRKNEKDYYMNIMHVERDEYEVAVEAYSLSFELLNEQRGAYKASSAMSFEEYLAVFDPEHVITLGTNEVSEKRITNEWTGEDTILARLFSLATVFSAELEFLPELNDNYSLRRIVMNVYQEHSDTTQGVGQRRTDLTLRYNQEISGITKISDITELYTAITPTGRDGLTLASLDKTEYDSEGNVEYRKPAGSTHLYAVQARDRFPSNLMANENERYIGVNWEYDTDNVETLYGQALAQLKKNCVPKVSYEVEGYFDTNIGDTVTIADESFNPELYLEARVTEQHRSFTDPSGNKTTFDNFKELQSQIDESLLARVEELIAQGKTYTAMISTNNGIVFKNGVGETTMTAHVRDAGGVELAQNFEIHWYKDGSEAYIGNPYTISADDVDGKAVYRFEAVDASGTVKAFYEVTVSDVSDGQDGEDGEPGPEGPAGPIGPPGADGKSLYTWIKYADSPTTGMSDTPEGKQYMGIAYNQESPVESTDYGDYEWSLITGEGVPGPAGEDGKTYYTWIRYADDASGNGMSDSPEGKDYIGIAYNQESRTESNNPKDYVWSLFRGPQGIQGPQGEQGVPGPAGDDGKTTYFHIKYSPNANGDPMSEVPDVYIGTYVDFNQIDSTDPEDYTWMRFQGAQGADGAQGIPGTNGEDGKTSYLHIAYANSADGTVDFSITESDGKSYIGQYVDFEINDSENPADYNWTKIKGEDGMSLYTWIKYADTPTTGMSDSPDGKQYMGIAYNKTTPEESTRYEDYTWSRITGEGIPGAPGEDGKTFYTWVRYADNAQGEGISDNPEGKDYIGLAYNKETPMESNDPSDYTWSLFRGPQGIQGPQGETGPQGPTGPQGTPGPAGTDGRTSYFHVKYSSVSNPTSSSQMTETPSEYIGTYVDFTEMDSNDPSDYTWSRFRGMDGSQGIPGTNGEDGRTSYLHIAYANSADGHTSFSISDSTGRAYMGQYVDFIQADSNDPDDYTWSKIKGEDGKVLYTWIKYADTPTTGMSDSPDGKKYMGIAYNKESKTESTKYSDYDWSLILGEGIPGEAGEDGKTLYTWVKYADDAQGNGISDSPTGKNYIGLAYNKETATESNSPSDYTWALFRGPQGVPGNPGEKGEQGTPGENGRSYVIESSVPEIKVSGDGFTPDRVTFNMYFYDGSGNRQDLDVYAVADQFIDGEWVQSWTWTTKSNVKTIFTSVIDQATEFVRLTVYNTRSDGIFSDKLAEYTLPITFNTFSAPGTYTSDTAPTQPFAGMLWKNTGTAGGYIQNAIYQWNGSEWTLYYFAAANLDVKKLSAISGDMGELTAGSIEIPWEYTDNPQFTIQGTTKFSKSEGGTNPISVEFKLINKGTQEVDATGSAVYDYNGVTISINYTTGESRRMRLGYGSLSFSDNENTATFGLSEILKLKSGAEEWTALPLNTNYVASESNTPMYRKVPIYGSTSWKVELKGQVARRDGENVHGTVGTLPEGYRPSDSVIYMQADDTFMGARVAVVNTGAVQSRTVYNSKYVSLDGISFEVEE